MGRLNDEPLPIYVGQSFISPILGGCRLLAGLNVGTLVRTGYLLAFLATLHQLTEPRVEVGLHLKLARGLGGAGFCFKK